MLRDLTIKNYRAFKDFSIDGLARVNLIVGKNNAGKTSFLEALYLLTNAGSRTALLNVLHNRGEYSELNNSNPVEYLYPIAHLYFGHNPIAQTASHEENTIVIKGHNEIIAELRISLETVPPAKPLSKSEGRLAELAGSQYRQAYQNYIAIQNELFPLRLHMDYGTENFSYAVDEKFAIRTNTFQPDMTIGSNRFVTTNAPETALLAQLWDALTPSPAHEETVIEALRILEPDIEDLRLLASRGPNAFLVKQKNVRDRVPLSSLGEGVRRILALSASAVTAENGVLLVDEIDTGLYHGAQTAMWQSLLDIAKRLNVQIFATTHSWDCVEAFEEALVDSGEPRDGMLFRLQQRGDKIYPVDYSIEQLGIAVSHAIEVR